MHEKVKTYLETLPKWKEEISFLRKIVLLSGLKEDYKWKHPCYTFEDKNVLILQEFKEYVAILFKNGALMKDPKGLLVKLTENVQVDRQLRFSSMQEIIDKKDFLLPYIQEAIRIEKSGEKYEYKKTEDFPIPEELQDAFIQDQDLKEAFYGLTPGRQRGYLLLFNAGKMPQTRRNKIEEHRDKIMAGKGVNDCVCGHSKRKPNCDGSHRFINQSK